jgi:hypothetical protein
MQKSFLFLLMLFAWFTATAQWHDAYTHFSGYPEVLVISPHKSALVNYNVQQPQMEVVDHLLPNRLASITMSDKAGNLAFYTNGMKIFNKQHLLMENGDDINAGEVADDPQWQAWGYPVLFSTLCLPVGNNLYYYIHTRKRLECHHILGGDILYTVIDMNANDGLGKVLEKNKLIADCSNNNWSAVSATRHANGRDWWVIAALYGVNQYLRFIVNENGISDPNYITIDDQQGDWGNGQSFFNTDGGKYIDCRHARSARVYDFDRCTGVLGAYQEFSTKSEIYRGLGIGTAYAPNSRFIYLANTHFIVQVDLKAADIPASMDTVAVFDGFYDESPNKNCYFGLMQLMPNGVIYSPTFPYNHTRFLHEIRFPDRKGAACRPIQHSIRWPLTIGSVAYFPNYRLGPIDGSACDTLGINNLPLAHYRWDVEDSFAPLSVTFTDLSAYEPATWHWDFGDGSAVSQDTSPVHVFPAPGVYTVCLTVCNDYACDTLCREVTVGFSSTASPEQAAAGIVLYPNPASDLLQWSGTDGEALQVRIFDFQGAPVLERETADARIELGHLPTGIYLVQLTDARGALLTTQKILLLK